MNNTLKKEIAVMVAATALLVGLRTESKIVPAILGAGAAGLFLWSLRKTFDFKNKAVYITGGSRGLGLSIAWNLLEKGAKVTLVARDLEELERGKEILLKDFPQGEIYLSVCDITESKNLHFSIDEAIQNMGGLDLLVNNAGAILVGPIETMKMEDFEAQIKLHLYAAIDATQYVSKHFDTRGGGRILNICSMGGKIAVPHMLPYDVSKFALAGFSQGAASELALRNIIVTTAYPAVMRTGSPIQAVFKGDHQKEFAWFEAFDNMPVLSMSADTAAKKVLKAVADARTEIILSFPARLRMMVGAMLPEATNALMGLAAKLLPTGRSTERKTGADSRDIFEENALLKSLRKTAHKEEIVYNQRSKHDAEHNLGLS